MAEKIRWGLMGAGDILNRWMNGAFQQDDMEIRAIASRTRENAEKRGAAFGITDICTYEEMAARDDIDAVYISSVNTAHKELAVMALKAGKAVLVEKPASISAADFAEMTACAEENHAFLMEAMWMRFFPALKRIREIIALGQIGEVRLLQANFAFSMPREDPHSRLLDPAQGGGGLLDVGVYDLHFADLIMGKHPVKLKGMAAVNSDENRFGVDETAALTAQYDNGALAVMLCGVRVDIPDNAYIYGSKGRIEIPHYWKAQEFTVYAGDQVRTEKLPVPQHKAGITDEGFQFEIAHVNDCIREGKTESDVIPWAVTAEILKECDGLRKDWGIVFPSEKA